MIRHVVLALFIGIGLLSLADSTAAQSDSASTVAGSARVHVQPKPNRLRLQVELRAYGSTADAALNNLQTRCDAATAQLKTIEADAASIAYSIPKSGAPSENVFRGPVAYAAPVVTSSPVMSGPGPVASLQPAEAGELPRTPCPVVRVVR